MITDAMLKEAAAESCRVYTNAVLELCGPCEHHEFSEKFKRRIKVLRRRADHPVFYQTMRSAAAVFLAMLVAAGMWLSVDSEARATVFGWIKEKYEMFFVYSHSDRISAPDEPGDFRPGWIPSEYTEYKLMEQNGSITVIYVNESGQRLRFTQLAGQSSTELFADVGGMEHTANVVNGNDAHIFLSEDGAIANNIIWEDDSGNAFYISGFLSEDELIKMAESVKPVEE